MKLFHYSVLIFTIFHFKNPAFVIIRICDKGLVGVDVGHVHVIFTQI